MGSTIAAIIILIIGAVLFLIIRKSISQNSSPLSYYLLLLIVAGTLGMVAFVYSDKTAEPKEEMIDGVNTLVCDTDFVLSTNQDGTSVCYNESPFGHTIVGLFQIFTGVFAFCYVTQLTFNSWRRYLTPKMLYYLDKYQKVNDPINKHTDTYYSGDFTWAHEGFNGSIYADKNHVIHVAKNNMLTPISLHLIFKGKRQKVSSKWLWGYVGHNEKLFSMIVTGYPYDPKTHEFIKDAGTIPEIYVPMALSHQENELFNSIEGNYGFGANRTDLIIKNLYKMQNDIADQDYEMGLTQKETLAEVVDIADKYSTILNRVGDVKKENIIRQITNPQPQQYNPNQPQQGGYK